MTKRSAVGSEATMTAPRKKAAKKRKTVTVWACAVTDAAGTDLCSSQKKRHVQIERKVLLELGCKVGSIVKVELPLPGEGKP